MSVQDLISQLFTLSQSWHLWCISPKCSLYIKVALVVIKGLIKDAKDSTFRVDTLCGTHLRIASQWARWKWLPPSQRRWFSESCSSRLTGSRCYSQRCRSGEEDEATADTNTQISFVFPLCRFSPWCEAAFCSSTWFVFLFDFLSDDISFLYILKPSVHCLFTIFHQCFNICIWRYKQDPASSPISWIFLKSFPAAFASFPLLSCQMSLAPWLLLWLTYT